MIGKIYRFFIRIYRYLLVNIYRVMGAQIDENVKFYGRVE